MELVLQIDPKNKGVQNALIHPQYVRPVPMIIWYDLVIQTHQVRGYEPYRQMDVWLSQSRRVDTMSPYAL